MTRFPADTRDMVRKCVRWPETRGDFGDRRSSRAKVTGFAHRRFSF